MYPRVYIYICNRRVREEKTEDINMYDREVISPAAVRQGAALEELKEK